MIHLIYIGVGGFFGAVTRYIVSRFLNNLFLMFPLGTLFVNISGSFLLGFIIYSVGYGKKLPSNLRDLITIGFVGAYTTMSTFSYETFRLAEVNEIPLSFLNLLFNILFCLTAIYIGRELAILINK